MYCIFAFRDIDLLKRLEAVSKARDKEAWTVTETAETEETVETVETAETEEAVIAACDKKAITVFDEKQSAINAATTSVKAKFDAKKRNSFLK